jgi:hypothetical protein
VRLALAFDRTARLFEPRLPDVVQRADARSSRISSSSSFNAKTSSRSAGGTCFVASSGLLATNPSSCSKYSTREMGCFSVRYASFRYDDRSRLARRSAGVAL